MTLNSPAASKLIKIASIFKSALGPDQRRGNLSNPLGEAIWYSV